MIANTGCIEMRRVISIRRYQGDPEISTHINFSGVPLISHQYVGRTAYNHMKMNGFNLTAIIMYASIIDTIASS